MRVVVYSEIDYEPLTVIEVHIDDLKRLHPSGDYLRFLPRMKFDFKPWDASESVSCLMPKAITVRFERCCRHYRTNDEQLFWIGWAHDDGLELRSTLLPGQLAEFQWERVT